MQTNNEYKNTYSRYNPKAQLPMQTKIKIQAKSPTNFNKKPIVLRTYIKIKTQIDISGPTPEDDCPTESQPRSPANNYHQQKTATYLPCMGSRKHWNSLQLEEDKVDYQNSDEEQQLELDYSAVQRSLAPLETYVFHASPPSPNILANFESLTEDPEPPLAVKYHEFEPSEEAHSILDSFSISNVLMNWTSKDNCPTSLFSNKTKSLDFRKTISRVSAAFGLLSRKNTVSSAQGDSINQINSSLPLLKSKSKSTSYYRKESCSNQCISILQYEAQNRGESITEGQFLTQEEKKNLKEIEVIREKKLKELLFFASRRFMHDNRDPKLKSLSLGGAKERRDGARLVRLDQNKFTFDYNCQPIRLKQVQVNSNRKMKEVILDGALSRKSVRQKTETGQRFKKPSKDRQKKAKNNKMEEGKVKIVDLEVNTPQQARETVARVGRLSVVGKPPSSQKNLMCIDEETIGEIMRPTSMYHTMLDNKIKKSQSGRVRVYGAEESEECSPRLESHPGLKCNKEQQGLTFKTGKQERPKSHFKKIMKKKIQFNLGDDKEDGFCKLPPHSVETKV